MPRPRTPKPPEVRRSRGISVDDLPIAELKRKLEQTWQPDGDTFLLPGSVGRNALKTQLLSDMGTASALHLVGATGSPAFENSWTNFDAAERQAAYYRASGRVYLQGLVRGGVVGAAIFTLPAEFRPSDVRLGAKLFAINSNGAFGDLRVFADGRVVLSAGSNVFASLDGVSFRIA